MLNIKVIKKLFVGMSTVSLLLFSQMSFADLHLELTQGVDAALPLAVVPFQQSANTQTNISAIIQQDLENSGRFSIPDPKDFKQTPHAASSVNLNYWRKLGVDNVVVGSVAPNTQGDVVKVELLDVFRAMQGEIKSPVLFAKQYNAENQDLRHLSHHIANAVYQKLTGERGIFTTRLAYVQVKQVAGKRQYALIIANYDGKNPQVLVQSDEPLMSPAWSPDGKKIAFVSFEKQRSQIFVINVATGQRQLITEFAGINGAPAWSPDGTQLAIVLSKTGSPKIYSVSLSNGRLTQLTKGYSIDTEPSWSPDGKYIVYTSNRGGSPQIYRIQANGGNSQRMTFNGNYNARASYTPDGKSLVFLHRATGAFNIAVQDLASGNVTVLTQSGLDESPSIAPNGDMVIYATNYGGRGILGMVSLDGRVKLRLPAGQGNVQEPSWSPFLS